MGIVFGFLISPAKNGFGNNASNTTNNYYDKKYLTTDMLWLADYFGSTHGSDGIKNEVKF